MIERLLERKTDQVFPEKISFVSANIDQKELGPTSIQPPSFGVREEYELYLKVGVNFLANNAQYLTRREQAEKQLKFALYRDMIEDIHEALNVCEDSETSRILTRMLDRIGI